MALHSSPLLSVPPDDLRELLLVLSETTTMTLSTVEPDGFPRATPLYFATSPSAELVFLSDPATPHARNLAERPGAAIAAYPEAARWQEIRGVQMKGVAATLDTQAADRALDIYRTRFDFLGDVPAAFERMSVYLFRPRWARLIDNRRGFGAAREWGQA